MCMGWLNFLLFLPTCRNNTRINDNTIMACKHVMILNRTNLDPELYAWFSAARLEIISPDKVSSLLEDNPLLGKTISCQAHSQSLQVGLSIAVKIAVQKNRR